MVPELVMGPLGVFQGKQSVLWSDGNHVYSVLSENQPNRANNARPTWSRPVLWETISNKIWGQDFVQRFRLKRLLKW